MSIFIVIEGIDGSGSTTHTRLLHERISQNQPVIQSHEPTNGPIGTLLRAALRGDPNMPARDTWPWLFAADRADHLSRTIEPALKAGTVVISDRYYPSSLAYQSLTLPLHKIAALNAFRVPDLTVFIDVPVETCLQRIAARDAQREVYENHELLTQIDAQYRGVMDFLRARGEPIVSVNGDRPIALIHEQIWRAVQPLLPST